MLPILAHLPREPGTCLRGQLEPRLRSREWSGERADRTCRQQKRNRAPHRARAASTLTTSGNHTFRIQSRVSMHESRAVAETCARSRKESRRSAGNRAFSRQVTDTGRWAFREVLRYRTVSGPTTTSSCGTSECDPLDNTATRMR